MLVLGLQGSPRKKGNTNYLLSEFMAAAERLGAKTQTIHVDEKDIVPCKEYIVCEKKGFCPIKDDMSREIYALLRRADVIVMASPIFFYNVTAQMKALIDRSQTLWARKYKLQLTDPARNYRKGFMLAVGATKGKNLFEGVSLTAKYFFDAVGAEYAGRLTYRHIENKGDMEKHATVREDVETAAGDLLNPMLARKAVLFCGKQDACLSQMACAFTQYHVGKDIAAFSGGENPAADIDPIMSEVMAEKGIDMAFRLPRSIQDVAGGRRFDRVVNMGATGVEALLPDVEAQTWGFGNTSKKKVDFMRRLRDDIEERVKAFAGDMLSSA